MPEWLLDIPPRYGWTLLILALVYLFYRLAIGLLQSFSTRHHTSTPYVILRRIIRWLAVVLGVLLALQTLEVLQAAWASLTAAFTLVAVGFVAMWSVLSHATCAVVMMFSRPFDVGDTVEFPEAPALRGRVVDFSLLFTSLRTEAGDLIQVPNNAFFQRVVKRQKGDVEITLEEQFERDEPIDWSGEP